MDRYTVALTNRTTLPAPRGIGERGGRRGSDPQTHAPGSQHLPATQHHSSRGREVRGSEPCTQSIRALFRIFRDFTVNNIQQKHSNSSIFTLGRLVRLCLSTQCAVRATRARNPATQPTIIAIRL